MSQQWTTTYSGLLALLQTYVEDASTEFVAAAPGIINRAEERCLRDLDLSLFNDTLTTATSGSQATIGKPAVVHIVKSIYDSTSSRFLERRTYDYLKMYGGSGAPLYFDESDDAITFAPTPDTAYTLLLRYRLRPTPLSSGNTTNWLTTNASDLLLYAALVESEKFLIAPERVAEFENDYAKSLRAVRAEFRDDKDQDYEPLGPAPVAERTR